MNRLFTLFWNSNEQRPRTLWRLAGFLVLVVAFLIASMLVLVGAGLSLNPFSAEGMLLSSLLSLGATIAGAWVAGRFLDRRPFADFGFHLGVGWWRDLAAGLFLGALLMTAIFLVERAAGWITVTDTLVGAHPGWPFVLDMLFPVGAYICVGVQEELMFRGYLLRNMAEGMRRWTRGATQALLLAWLLSSLLFGLAHGLNPHTSLVSSINLVLAGIFLGVGYVLTGELALPIGLHIAWNLFQGNVYGFPVSGMDIHMASVLEIEQGGPDLWTGGAFGPEAGLLGVLAMLAGCALTLLWVRLVRGQEMENGMMKMRRKRMID